MRRLSCCFLLLLLAGAPPRCRYTVRDIGFVDLDDARWKLEVMHPADADEAWLTTLRATARSVFLHANATLRLVERSEASGAWFVSPGGDRVAVDLPLSKAAMDTTGFDRLEALVDSPARRGLADRVVAAHAVVAILLGPDAVENARVRKLADEAVEASRDVLEALPKPATEGAEVFEVPWTDRAKEAWLARALGAGREDVAVAVVYGRLRLMGEPLDGAAVTRSELRRRLVLIGQDCECELDRRLIRGWRLPFAWDEDRSRAVLQDRDFDPENPMVKAEISRILSRGPGGDPRPGLRGLEGYSETVIDEDPAPEQHSPSPPSESHREELPPRNDTGFGSETLIVLLGVIVLCVVGMLVVLRRSRL